MKVKSRKSLLKEADKWFSLYIRLSNANKNGYVKCCTCSAFRHYKDRMQCGHYHSRSHMSLRFSEENTDVQCEGCNMWAEGGRDKGRPREFAVHLTRKYGEGHLEKLLREKNKVCPMGVYELQQVVDKYKPLVKELLETIPS